ncbi:MAG: type II secretion system protein [Candidatus Cloacimonetes bacterium]|nr:type II secretion system protein [Candidatus Cloacimonadota bacterium]
MLKKRGAFTLIEMLIAFAIAMFILSVFYLMYGTYQNRLIKVIQKSQGQQAVRLLSTKIRQELKSAIGVVIPESNTQTEAIRILMGEQFGHQNYSVEYSYVREKKAIAFVERDGDSIIRQGIFLGGQTQILGFYTGSNQVDQQILTQKHRIDITIEYFDTVQTKTVEGKQEIRPMVALVTVYPRYTNMLLRIDVPQT